MIADGAAEKQGCLSDAMAVACNWKRSPMIGDNGVGEAFQPDVRRETLTCPAQALPPAQ
jgi:hypothetical protein